MQVHDGRLSWCMFPDCQPAVDGEATDNRRAQIGSVDPNVSRRRAATIVNVVGETQLPGRNKRRAGCIGSVGFVISEGGQGQG